MLLNCCKRLLLIIIIRLLRLILRPCAHWPCYRQLKMGWCVSLQSKKTCGDLCTLGVGVVAEAQQCRGGRELVLLFSTARATETHTANPRVSRLLTLRQASQRHTAHRENTHPSAVSQTKSHTAKPSVWRLLAAFHIPHRPEQQKGQIYV